MTDNINKIRNSIDETDKKLVELFEKRMEAVLKIAEYKKANNIPILDKNREAEVIKKNLSFLNNKNLEKETTDFLNSLMAISRSYQARKLLDDIKNTEIIRKL